MENRYNYAASLLKRILWYTKSSFCLSIFFIQDKSFVLKLDGELKVFISRWKLYNSEDVTKFLYWGTSLMEQLYNTHMKLREKKWEEVWFTKDGLMFDWPALIPWRKRAETSLNWSWDCMLWCIRYSAHSINYRKVIHLLQLIILSPSGWQLMH